jgi:chromatin structure-remodeling complex subunit RSC9
MGVAFLAALLFRNLARALRSEISQALPAGAEQGSTDQYKAMKRKHLMEERFGLPIPETVLKEEEEEERDARRIGNSDEGETLSREERERARLAFEAVEERVMGVIEINMAGLGQYLSEAFGFGGMEW